VLCQADQSFMYLIMAVGAYQNALIQLLNHNTPCPAMIACYTEVFLCWVLVVELQSPHTSLVATKLALSTLICHCPLLDIKASLIA